MEEQARRGRRASGFQPACVGLAVTALSTRLLAFTAGLAGRGRALHASMVSASSTSQRVTTTTDGIEAEKALLTAITALGGSAITQEEILSFYWWEGSVQNDAEKRLSFDCDKPLSDILQTLGAVHNYDVPMIIADSETPSSYLKGLINSEDASELATQLARSRLVACAQVSPGGSSLAVKTTAKAKAAVEALVPSIKWTHITGNTPYLDWLDAETREAVDKSEAKESCG